MFQADGKACSEGVNGETKVHLSRKIKTSKSPDDAVVSGNQTADPSSRKPRLGI